MIIYLPIVYIFFGSPLGLDGLPSPFATSMLQLITSEKCELVFLKLQIRFLSLLKKKIRFLSTAKRKITGKKDADIVHTSS